MKRLAALLLLALLSSSWAGCNGSTGGGLVSFSAFVGGPAGVVAGEPSSFATTDSGYQITLTEAKLHVGAVYFNKTVPSSGSPEQQCILPGVYVDEVFGGCSAAGVCGVDVDLLSPTPVPFPMPGDGTLDEAFTAEIWLSGGDINAADDETPILQVAGTATSGGDQWPFTGLVTIGTNHTSPPPNAAMPGANPICRQRIVAPSLKDPNTLRGLTIANGGTLTVRVSLANLFNGVEFALLAPGGSLTTVTIPNDSSRVGEDLFDGLTSNQGLPMAGLPDRRVYQFDVSNP